MTPNAEKVRAPSSAFRQDENGEWWQHRPRGGRVRATLGTCHRCSASFVQAPNPKRPKSHCDRACYAACVREGGHPALTHRGRPAEQSHLWKGGRLTRRGYVLIYMPEHHTIVGRGTTRKYVLEHRVVMERVLGRNLEPHETVHHINGVTDDNRPENLELWSLRAQPPGQRVDEARHCPSCTCGHAQ